MRWGLYRPIKARCRGLKTLVATARKIAEPVHWLLKDGEEYVQQGEATNEAA